MHTRTVKEIRDYINKNNSTSFEWGAFDCCVFVSDIIKIQTGIDTYEKYKGKYKTEREAAIALKKIGSIESTLDEHFKRTTEGELKRGDIVMLDSGVMAAFINMTYWSTTKDGVFPVDGSFKKGWRIE